LEKQDALGKALNRLTFALFDKAPLVIIFPLPAGANGFANVQEMTVQPAALSLDDESLGFTTQHFALHQFTPLESAALKIV
jgi:hypothetical protein